MFKFFGLLSVLVLGAFIVSCSVSKYENREPNTALNFELEELFANDAFIKDYNIDSTYVIIYNLIDRQSGERLNFDVFNTVTNEKEFTSRKEYAIVNWSENYLLQMIKNPLPNSKLNADDGQSIKKTFYNIKQKTFIKPY